MASGSEWAFASTFETTGILGSTISVEANASLKAHSRPSKTLHCKPLTILCVAKFREGCQKHWKTFTLTAADCTLRQIQSYHQASMGHESWVLGRPELLFGRLHEMGVEGPSHSQPHCHPSLELLSHLLNSLQMPHSCEMVSTFTTG